MEWKEYLNDYEISDSGLLRRRNGVPGNPAGKLLSPQMPHKGSASYFLKNASGSKTYKRIHIIMSEVFGLDMTFNSKWVDGTRDHVAEYNAVTFGHCNKQKKRDKFVTPPMWDANKFGDPWDDYKPYRLSVGEYGLADLCPLG